MTEPAKYVFLDRDGVINKDLLGISPAGYVTRWEEFVFIPGVKKALKVLSDGNFKVIIISNQQGVGKGFLSEQDLDDVTEKMIKAVAEEGGTISGVYYCTHLKNTGCECRKPGTGLFEKAVEEHGVDDLKGSFFVGDSERDIEAGNKFGMRTILVLSGKSSEEDVAGWKYRPDHIAVDLMAAADLITKDQ